MSKLLTCWKDASRAYGPHEWLCNRHKRWSEKGVWRSFEALAVVGSPLAETQLDRQHARECAAVGEGGLTPRRPASAGVAATSPERSIPGLDKPSME